MNYSKHLVFFCILALTSKAYAAFNIFGSFDSSSDSELESDFDHLADDVHPPAAGFGDFWKLGKNILSYFSSSNDEDDVDEVEHVKSVVDDVPILDFKPVFEDVKPAIEDVKPVVEDVKPAIEDVKPVVEDANITVEDVKPVEDVTSSIINVADIYEKMHKNIENGQEILKDYKIPSIQDFSSTSITSTNSNSNSRVLRRAVRKNLDQQSNYSVTSRRQEAPLAIFSGAFLLKAQMTELEQARARLRPIPEASSPSYANIINFLYNSYMGDFDFSLVHRSDRAKSSLKSGADGEGRSGNVLPSFIGDVWLKTDWSSIKSSDNELHTQIKFELCQAAPKTMTALPSLAPKKIRERDVLEGWLIDGLLAAYPTMRYDLSKADAIALILLAIFSKDFRAPENFETVKQIFEDLQKYDGAYLGTFPFDQFKFDADDNEQLTRTLFQVIEEQELDFSAHVVKEILNRS